MSDDRWFKNEPEDTIWWLNNADEAVGKFVFSFDKKRQYNMFADYPHALTAEQKRIFDSENPFWAEFFSDR